jgi:hypothetical protein
VRPFEIIGDITDIKTIAIGAAIRELAGYEGSMAVAAGANSKESL